jgi:hypothetical protein
MNNEEQIIGRIAAIEYILNQAFSFSLTKFDAPLDVLTECEDHLTRNLAASGLKEDQKLVAQHFATRFYSAVRASIVSDGEHNFERLLND